MNFVLKKYLLFTLLISVVNFCFGTETKDTLNNKKLDSIRTLLGTGYYIDSAREKLHPILKEVLMNNDSDLIRRAYNEMGISYAQEENYSESLKYFYLKEKYSFSKLDKGNVYHNISVIYDKNKNYNKSLEANIKAIKLLEEVNDSITIIFAYSLRAKHENHEGDYTEAEFFLKKAIEISEKTGDIGSLAEAYANLGLNNLDLKNYENALPLFLKAEKLYKTVHNLDWVVLSNSNIAKTYARLNKEDSAQKYIAQTLFFLNEYKVRLETQIGAYNAISLIFEKYNNFDKAIFYRKKKELLLDSLKKKNNVNDYLTIELNHQSTKNKEETSTNNFNIIIFFLLGVALLLIILFFGLKSKIKKKQVVINEDKIYLSDLNLTKREKEIGELILKGLSSPDISKKLFISVNTVNSHRKNIYKKAKISSLSEFILKYKA